MDRCSNCSCTCTSDVEWDRCCCWLKGFIVTGDGGGTEPKSLKWESCCVKAIVPSSTTANITHMVSVKWKLLYVPLTCTPYIYLQNKILTMCTVAICSGTCPVGKDFLMLHIDAHPRQGAGMTRKRDQRRDYHLRRTVNSNLVATPLYHCCICAMSF